MSVILSAIRIAVVAGDPIPRFMGRSARCLDLRNVVLCLYGGLFLGVPSAPWERLGIVPSMIET